MNTDILSNEVQKFIEDNLNSDIHKILLGKKKFHSVTAKELVEQIESKLKAKTKLPSWFASNDIYYPNKLNLSQTSSEVTASYKSSLINGKSVIDITGGFGVDTFAFSKIILQVFHVEKNDALSKIAKHNFQQLGADNIHCISNNGTAYLKNTTQNFDWIYVDPSRRDINNKKVYYLSDCEPNVTDQIDDFFSKSNNILIKTGPLLDITTGLRELKHVKEIHIVAVNNDVKELLWVLEKDYHQEALIKTINFKGDNSQTFEFKLSDEQNAQPSFSNPLDYIFEPNAAILKSGAFQYIAEYFELSKLHPNSHLYTSNQVHVFPGRIFKVEELLDYSKKAIKKASILKANITTRNFPDSVATVRKKLKIKEGGNTYIFCTTNENKKLVLISCSQLSN